MIGPEDALRLLTPGTVPSAAALEVISRLGFEQPAQAILRFAALCQTPAQRRTLTEALPVLLHALVDVAAPDASLLNFERFVQSVKDRAELFRRLSQQPRSVEILVRLFVSSQFLTEILLRNPHYLNRLSEHKRLAEFKSRQDIFEQGAQAFEFAVETPEVMTELRRFHQWETLRLAACDTFGLMDLKTITLQLSLLADALVQLSLRAVTRGMDCDLDDFAVLAFGKLGGEELNYSSDIDLVFVCRGEPDRFWQLGQRLIKVLGEGSEVGFMYRVDMRLRPWGSAGSLVTTGDAYVDYLRRQGQPWEKQALLKARAIAGNLELGDGILRGLHPLIFEVAPAVARRDVREMKDKIERQLIRRGQTWGEVKAGPGGIRDVEFITQFLQLTSGAEAPRVRSRNTLDGLARLADAGFLFPEEYRRLSEGYLFLRSVEHALQLTHNMQEHALPASRRELEYLARRLDFPDAETFVRQYDLHTRSIREIFQRYLEHEVHPLLVASHPAVPPVQFAQESPRYAERFGPEEIQGHLSLLAGLTPAHPVRLTWRELDATHDSVTIVGTDWIGELSTVCGLLFASGFDIEEGTVFTGDDVETISESPSDTHEPSPRSRPERRFLNVFRVRHASGWVDSTARQRAWREIERDLVRFFNLFRQRGVRVTQGRLARHVAAKREELPSAAVNLLPLEIEADETSQPDATVLHIRGEDTPGFLYELANALAISGVSIRRTTIETIGNRVTDALHVVDERGRKLQSGDRLRELRAAIALIRHFTHLLPQSSDPAAALVHFQEFLENLFQQPNWLDQLSPLQDSHVLTALTKLLGISDFLWDDFLKLQHENLFPVVTNVQGLQRPRKRSALGRELRQELEAAPAAGRRGVLNAFKDREMMRADMRHILGLQDKFGMFAAELTYVAEAVVEAAVRICQLDLQALHGSPISVRGEPARLSVCALGKFGGRELGYASDIEVLFLYDEDGQTNGPQPLSNLEYFQRLVTLFESSIRAKRKGIFEIDLRLRPYGRAGSLAVSRASFRNYFGPEGAAWPYERQALVKLRPVAGDAQLGREISDLRDRLIYRGEPFDVAAMRALREKQNRQLVLPGTFNAKLSPGGLVDCEYLVQGLQITYGHLDPAIREPNTREAMKALQSRGILAGESRLKLRDAYRFFRRVIDALRMVRGDASELTVPPREADEFDYLARRLGYARQASQLDQDLETHTRNVLDLVNQFETMIAGGLRVES